MDKRVIKYVPECFNAKTEDGAEHAVFQGHVLIEMPSLVEIEEICAETGMYDQGGENMIRKKGGAVKILIEAYKIGRERFIKGAEITRTSDGKKFSLEDLDYVPGLSKLVLELGTKFCRGFEPGNEPEPQSASN